MARGLVGAVANFYIFCQPLGPESSTERGRVSYQPRLLRCGRERGLSRGREASAGTGGERPGNSRSEPPCARTRRHGCTGASPGHRRGDEAGDRPLSPRPGHSRTGESSERSLRLRQGASARARPSWLRGLWPKRRRDGVGRSGVVRCVPCITHLILWRLSIPRGRLHAARTLTNSSDWWRENLSVRFLTIFLCGNGEGAILHPCARVTPP